VIELPYITCNKCGGQRWPDHPKDCKQPCCKALPGPIKVKQTQEDKPKPVPTPVANAFYIVTGNGFIFGLYNALEDARRACLLVERDSSYLTHQGPTAGYRPVIHEIPIGKNLWGMRVFPGGGMYAFITPNLGRVIE
jgi:hypothetical protein